MKGNESSTHFEERAIDIGEVAGNILADEVAGSGAAMNAADPVEVSSYLKAFGLVQKIQRRAIAALQQISTKKRGKNEGQK